MAPTRKKRLLLLCGTSLLTLQLIATPYDFAGPHRGLAPSTAAAQEASCFVAGTLVLMVDGQQRTVETLQPGDQVLGRRGRVNRVVACERTRLGRRRLYAFNGGEPFVTAEHPFLTIDGWKALDPEATRLENDRLPVTALQLGDRLCRGTARSVGGERRSVPTGPGMQFLQAATLLESVSAVEGEPDTPLFNLLLDGDHSYVANGWIVHNKEGDGGAGGDSDSGAGTSGGDSGSGGGGGSDGGGDSGSGSSDGGGGSEGGSGSGGDGGSDGGGGSGGGGGSDGGGGGSDGGDGSGAGGGVSGSDSGSGSGSSVGSGSGGAGDSSGGNSAGNGGSASSSNASDTGGDAASAGTAPEGHEGPSDATTQSQSGPAADGSTTAPAASDPAAAAAPGQAPAAAGKASAPVAAQPGRPQTSAGPIRSLLGALGLLGAGGEAGVAPTGGPLTKEQVRNLIDHRWRQRD